MINVTIRKRINRDYRLFHKASIGLYIGLLILIGVGVTGCSSGGGDHSVAEINEDFSNNGSEGFFENQYFSFSNSRFKFQGNNEDEITWTAWNGGTAPSNRWFADPGNSNYFDQFHLSVDTYFNSGDPSHVYGLIFCLRRDSNISFFISNDSYYLITKTTNGTDEILVNWKRTFLVSPTSDRNTLSVDKSGNQYHFRINGVEIETLTIPGLSGGAIGLIASLKVDVSFDNFILTSPEEVISDYTSVEKQNFFVYNALQSSYYWYDKITPVDYTTAPSPADLLDQMVYADKDRWSYIVSKETYATYIEEGKYIGVGFNASLENTNAFKVRFVTSNSPAAKAGLERGDTITAINGLTIENIEKNDLWDTVLPKKTIDTPVTLDVTQKDGSAVTLNLKSTWVTMDTLPYYTILTTQQLNIGYLVFNNFIERAEDDLTTVFDYFKREGVDELIVDLRYNPGGQGHIAQVLASLIAGEAVEGKLFTKLEHNDQYNAWDKEFFFYNLESALNLDRVVFITAPGTCSASELLIKGLEPYVDVVTIGDTTCGKPVGMYGYDFGDQYISYIEFKVKNAQNEGDYFDGIEPDCMAADDLDRLFGDVQESSLKEALYFIVNSHCSNTSLAKSKKLSAPREIKSPLKGFRKEIGAF